MDESTQEIKKYIDALPPLVRTAVLAPDWHARIGEIGTKYSLHLDQISELEYETLFVMIGMEPETDFIDNIEKEVSVSRILATQLAEEINDRVFKVILKSIEDKSTPKAPRFVEKEPQKEVIQPVVQPAPVAQPIHKPQPVIHMNEKGALLTDIEKMSDAPAPMARVVPPPVNLPIDGQERMEVAMEKKQEVKNDMQQWADAPTYAAPRPIVTPPTPMPAPKPIPLVVPAPTPQTPVAAPSLADAKLNNVIAVESETTKISHVDPYREPIE